MMNNIHMYIKTCKQKTRFLTVGSSHGVMATVLERAGLLERALPC